MNPKYPLIAAAVAAAVGASYANAATTVPTITSAASPSASLVMAGSSAAESSVANALATDLCGGSGNMLTVQSAGGSKNFYAFSCYSTPTNITGVPSNTLTTVYYRTEGGSVVGALPLIPPGHNVLRLNLSNSSCSSSGNSGTCTVTGVTSVNGTNDSWSGAVVEGSIDLGVTDVEPGKLIGADYPSNYSTSIFGNASTNQAALPGLSHVPAVQQVFGIAVNTTGLKLATAGTVNLSKEAVANIYANKYTDWSSVPDALTGAAVSSGPAGIVHVDREPGSGTRTSANIYFFNYPCAGTTAIQNTSGSEVLNYSTGDDLNLANSTPGSITYASIDNLLPPKNTSYTNLVLATINGVTPSTLAAAAGEYDFWFEATLVPNAATTGTSANLSTWLQTDLPRLGAAPLAADINVIPNVAGNTGAVPLTSRVGTSATIYINPFTRQGNSCNVPVETN
jgi:hypothetical protein